MVYNTTFNNSLIISRRSVLLMDETGVLREYLAILTYYKLNKLVQNRMLFFSKL